LDGKTETELQPGTWYLAVRAGGASNARYRLQVFVGQVFDLALNGPGFQDIILEHADDWFYCRVKAPTALPLLLNVTFSKTLGDLVMHLRDTLPPGNGEGNSQTLIRDWTTDKENKYAYGNFPNPATYTFGAGPVRPGKDLILGFHARKRSQFGVKVDNVATGATEPAVVPFYGGNAITNVPGFSTAVFRVDVPEDARRWK